MQMRYKGRPSAKTIVREFPFVVEIMVPEGGLGRRLDDMHEFHRQRGIIDQRGPGGMGLQRTKTQFDY
jgi:hypothetical protein